MKTILIVDDHPRLLQTLSRLLEAQGYSCLCSTTVEDAERIFRVSEVDLAIVDNVIENRTGPQFAAEIKRQKNVPVILLTGDFGIVDKPHSVDILLRKPTDPFELLGSVSALIS